MNNYYVDPAWCFEKPDEAASELERLHKWCDEFEAERDALAAQTKRCIDLLTHVLKQFEKHELGEELDSEEDALAWAEKARAAISDTPTTSLARLKAQWQAEALEKSARGFRERSARGWDTLGAKNVSDQIELEADELRRQSEGGE